MSSIKKYTDKKGQSYPHLYIDTNSGEFWCCVRVGLSVRKKNLKTTEYIRAVTKLPETLAFLGGKLDEKQKSQVAELLLKDYWQKLRAQKVSLDTKESTLTRFDSVWTNDLEPYFGNWTPSQINPDIMTAFLLWHKRVRKTQLVNVYKYLGNLFSYMVRIGALELKNVPELELPKNEVKHHAKKKGRVITPSEQKDLLKNSTGYFKLLNHLGRELGARKMEMVSLEKSKVRKEHGRYLIYLDTDDTKTGLARILPVPRYLESMLEEQMRATAESKYLFPMKSNPNRHMTSQLIDKEWKECKTKSKIKGRLRFHDWRHTKATEMAQAKINVVLASTLLGMSIKTYQKTYLNLTGQDLMETVDQMALESGKK
jgi:integrase